MKECYVRRKSLGLKGLLIIVVLELKALGSNKHIIYQGILSPILYFFFYSFGIKSTFGNIMYHGREVNYLTYSIIGIFAMSLFKEMYQCVYRMVTDRRWGLLSYKILNGVNIMYYILGIATFPLVGVVLQSTILYFMACIFGGGFSIYYYFKIEGILIIGVLFWTAIFACVSLLLKDYKIRDFVMNILFLPILFATPLFYSLEGSPLIIRVLAQFNPLTYQLEAMRNIVFEVNSCKYIIINIAMATVAFIISNIVLQFTSFDSNDH